MKMYLVAGGMDDVRRISAWGSTWPAGYAVRALFSYWYAKKQDLDAELGALDPVPRLFCDSGAFSAMTRGASIDVHAYGDWLLRYRRHFEYYANLDVIRDHEGTWNNQLILEAMGLHPLPVFHVAEPWAVLDTYMENYPLIALGVAGFRAGDYMGWLVQCFKRAAGSNVRFHGFGITTPQVMLNFPWYSCDSTTYLNSSRFGCVRLFDKRTGVFNDCKYKERAVWFRHAATIREWGFNPEDFANYSKAMYYPARALAARSFVEAARWHDAMYGVNDEDQDHQTDRDRGGALPAGISGEVRSAARA